MEQKERAATAALIEGDNNKCTEETKTRQTNEKKKEGDRSIVNAPQLFRADPLVNIEPPRAGRVCRELIFRSLAALSLLAPFAPAGETEKERERKRE